MASGPPPAGAGAQAPGGGAPGVPPGPAPAPQPDLLTNSTPAQGTVPQSSSGEGGASQAQGPGAAGGAPRAPSPDDRPKVMQRVGSGIRHTLRGKKVPAPALGTSEKNLPSTNPSVVNEVARKYLVSYEHLSKTLRQISNSPEQKKQQQQLIAMIFPKLAVYNSVDPLLAQPFLTLLQSSTDPAVLRWCYYFLGRILGESGGEGYNEGGGVPAPNWGALGGDEGEDGVSMRSQAIPLIVARLVTEASTPDASVHHRRVAALKALSCAPVSNDEAYASLVQIIFAMLDSVSEDRKKRRRWSQRLRVGAGKDAALRANLFYAALSALRRLPMEPTNATLIERVTFGIACPDPVGLRHALAMAADLARENPLGVATSLASNAGGSLAQAIRSPDLFARVYLARLCGTIIHSAEVYDRADFRGLFSAFLFQLLYDPEAKVCLEALACMLGCTTSKGEPSTDQRADGWQILTTSVMDTRGAAREVGLQEKKAKEMMPVPATYDLVIKVATFRLDLMLRSPVRPMLHGALRVIGELGKARAAAHSIGLVTEAPEDPQEEALDFQEAMGRVAPREKVKVEALLGEVMESVRCMTACESIYVRAQALKAMIWMQSAAEPVEEIRGTLAGELTDPEWTAPVLNDLLEALHARFEASPSMAVTILDLATLFVRLVPAKVDTNVLQRLWKTCLLGCGPEGKQLALEAVSNILDLPPTPPPAAPPLALSEAAARLALEKQPLLDAQAAVAMRRIVQAAIWFLGENANFAAQEYAWESATPPGAALMLLDTERMVAAAGVRNPTLAAASARLQRCAIIGSWEERVVAAYALMSIALRSGEPYRLQIYEFFHTLMYGGGSTRKVRGMAYGTTNGEDRGASGTGLAVVIAPMLKVLDEMYRAQDQMMKDIRSHTFSNEEWKEEELEAIFDMHERLTDLAMLFCFVPRAKYLPLGPISARLIAQSRHRHGMEAGAGRNDARLRQSLQKLLSYASSGAGPTADENAFPPVTLLEPIADLSLTSAQNQNAPGGRAPDDEPLTPRQFMGMGGSTFDDALYESTLLEADADNESELSDDEEYPSSSAGFSQTNRWDEESLPDSRRNDSARDRDAGLPSAASQSGSESGAPTGYAGALGFDEQYEMEQKQRASAAAAQGNLQEGEALYKFVAGDEEELSLEVGDRVEVEYEADGWYHVRKPNGDSGFVPAMYLSIR